MKLAGRLKTFHSYGVAIAGGAIALGSILLTGCGGGEGGGPAVPQGNAGVRAIAIAADQSIASGRAFPLAAILDTAPMGSVFTRAAQEHGKSSHTRAGGSPVFDASLGLYKVYTIKGNTESVTYYTDSAGIDKAGTASMTIVGATSFNTSYTAYPVTVNFTANVTGGKLPFSGTGSVVFNGPTGENSLTGKFTLPANNIVVSGKLNLDSSTNVSGSVDVLESGATLHVTNVSGKLTSDITGDVSSEPYGWKGTGTFNLQTGKFSITLNTGTGTATAASDASGSLTLHFADGTSQTINNPLSSNLAGIDTGPGSGNGGGNNNGGGNSATYGAPIALGTIYPHAINNSGLIAALEFPSNTGRALFLPSPGATPQYLAPFNGFSPYVLFLDDSGEILGFSSDRGYAYYLTPSSAPIGLTGGELALNSKGAVVGYVNSTAFYQLSLSGARIDLMNLGSDGAIANAVSPNGQIVGRTYSPYSNGATKPLYWSSPTATTVPQPLKDIAGDTLTSPQFINDKGQIVGSTTAPARRNALIYWTSPTDQNPQLLPDLFPNANSFSDAFGMNSSGQIVGNSGGQAALWKDGKVTNLNTVIPANSGWTLDSATAINDQGWIVGTGSILDAGGTHAGVAFLIKPK